MFREAVLTVELAENLLPGLRLQVLAPPPAAAAAGPIYSDPDGAMVPPSCRVPSIRAAAWRQNVFQHPA